MVRRVTVFDGVDIPITIVRNTNIFEMNGARLVPVSIGQNYVTYDIEFIFNDNDSAKNISFAVRSNLISTGEDIDEILSGINLVHADDIHVRDVTNGRAITNHLFINLS